MAAVITPIDNVAIKIVANALTSGDIPNRKLEKITIGKVVAPGPATKLAITTSSKDKAKANNHPKIIEGAIIGRVTTKKTFNGDAPKSKAASSIDLSKSCNRDWTTIVTYDKVKVV